MNLQTLVIIAAITMLTLAVGIVVFVILYQRRVINHQHQLKDFNRKKQEELMQASIRSEEEERMRIAAELHDDVGATLSSIRLMLSKAAKQPEQNIIGTVSNLLDESIQKVRNLSHQLQPGTLQYLGLVKSLQSLAEMLTRTGQISVELDPASTWPAIDSVTDLALYRVVQELLNNIIKHSGASKVTITTGYEGHAAAITLVHDGTGLNDALYREMLYKKGAIGLKNIENRLKSIGGSIVFSHSAANSLYLTTIALPVSLSNQTSHDTADLSHH